MRPTHFVSRLCGAGLVCLLPANSAFAQTTAVPDTIVVGLHDSVILDVTGNDSSATGTIDITSIDTSQTLGTVAVSDSLPGIAYTAPSSLGGDDHFGYEISDGAGGSSAATVLVRFTPGLSVDFHTIALYNNSKGGFEVLVDVGPNSLHGVAPGASDRGGPLGLMRCYDGVDDRANMDRVLDAVAGLSAFSLEFVARPDSAGRFAGVISHSNFGGWVVLPSATSTNYGLKLSYTGGGWVGGSWQSAGHDAAPDSAWNYYALTWTSGDLMRLYRNGVEIGTRDAGVGTLQPAQNFGAYVAYDDFLATYQAGCVDEIRFSSAGRTAEQVAATWTRLRDRLGQPSGVAVDDALDKTAEGAYRYSVYPNPFGDELTLRVDAAAPAAPRGATLAGPRSPQLVVEVFDLTGRRLLQHRASRAGGDYRLPVTGLPRGSYIVRVAGEASRVTEYATLVVRR